MRQVVVAEILTVAVAEILTLKSIGVSGLCVGGETGLSSGDLGSCLRFGEVDLGTECE